jgi:CRISPR-associated protein Cas1
VVAALEAVGLDPAVGFLHRDRPGRPSLALDLMEELRAFLADRLALSLINLQQIRAADFEQKETGGVVLESEARKTVLTAYQKRKQEEITHPFLGEKTTVGLLPHLQAALLARHLRGDLDGYPPFLWK